MSNLLPPQPVDSRVAYLGFPWATLIDLKMFATHRLETIARLDAALTDLATQVAGYDRVLTVCQHINMRSYADLFARAGVTDLYWAHAVRHQTHLPEAPQIRLHPFPLYPVQTAARDPHADNPLLFSFVGAKAHPKYLSQVRSHIVELLSDDPHGCVIETTGWHYARIVYDRQIMDRAKPDAVLTDEAAAERFRAVLARSTFALCPSGTGPNSIRLWEAATSGVIPVVLADTYRPPAEATLWRAATTTCEETSSAIAALPDRLAAIAADPARLAYKRQALSALTARYGPDRFVHDVLMTFPVTRPLPAVTAWDPAMTQPTTTLTGVRQVLRKAWTMAERLLPK